MKKRETKITKNYLMHPAGSVLIQTGNTKVICSVSVEESVPPFQREIDHGWLTAEYAMLPASTNTRNRREVSKGKISGRTAEIQRLIGRSLRAVVDLSKIPGITFQVDCDVIQADGGTRTASITGACVALKEAVNKLMEKGVISQDPIREFVAAISVGIIDGKATLDLDYQKDSHADVDMNVVMTETGQLVELQGTAEGSTFNRHQLNELLDLAEIGIRDLIDYQKEITNI